MEEPEAEIDIMADPMVVDVVTEAKEMTKAEDLKESATYAGK